MITQIQGDSYGIYLGFIYWLKLVSNPLTNTLKEMFKMKKNEMHRTGNQEMKVSCNT